MGRGNVNNAAKRELKLFASFCVWVLMLLLCLLFWYGRRSSSGVEHLKTPTVRRKSLFPSSSWLRLSTTMQIPWPGNYLAVFKVQSMVSSVGKEFIDVRCAMDEPISIAAVEYYKTLAYVLTSCCVDILSVIGWCTCGRVIRASERRAMLTGTIVLVLYLVYPSDLLQRVVLVEMPRGKGGWLVFMVDPETLCDDSTHHMGLGSRTRCDRAT